MFTKSIDALTHAKNATLLCELMDGIIQDIVLHNVVQIIADNVANNVDGGIFLMERHPILI